MLKSKNKFLLLLLVVLLVSGLCFGLIACKPKVDPQPDPDPDPNPPIEEPTSAEVFTEVINKIASSYSVGTDFKIDAAASADIRKKNADGTVSKGDEYAEGDFAFELIVKANVKLGKGFTDEDNYYLIELNDKVSGNSIVQLYFETQSGKDVADGNYFYASLFGSEVFKINGFSLEKAMGVNNNVSNTAAIELPGILNTVIGILFTEYEIKDGNYTFKTDINGIWGLVSMMAGDSESLKNLMGGIDIFAGIDLDGLFNGIDSAIAQLFPNLTLKDGTKVTGYDTMVKFINENIPKFTTNITFNFDGNTFKNASFYMDMVPQPDTFTGYTVNAEVSKVVIAVDTFPKADVLAGSFIEKNYTKNGAKIESRYTAEAINLVNFNYNTSVQFLDAEKKVVRDMDIRINADINPFSIIGGITKESIMNMGSFSIEIQNVNNGPYQLGIHYDPKQSGDDSVYYYIALSDNNAEPDNKSTMVLASSVSIINVIASLTNDIGYIYPGVATVAEGDIDIAGLMATIMKIVGAFNFSDNNVEIATAPIFETLKQFTQIDIGDLVVGAGTQYIKVAGGTFTYGGANSVSLNPNKWVAEKLKDKISNDTIVDQDGNNLNNGKYINSSTIKLTDKVQVPYGTPFEKLFQANSDGVYAGVSFKYFGSGETINANIKIQKALGYDPTKVGKQKVVLQASTNSDLSLIAVLVNIPGVNLMNILSNVPIEVEIEVLPADNNITTKINGTTQMVAGDNIIEKLKAMIITHDADSNEVEFALNKFMITACSEGVNFNNLTATQGGKQWIEVSLSTGKVRIEFNVVRIDINGIAVLGGNITEDLKAEITFVNANGENETRILGRADISTIKVDGVEVATVIDGNLVVSSNDTLDSDDKITIIDNALNLKKTISITYAYTPFGAEKASTMTKDVQVSISGTATDVKANTMVGDYLKLGSNLDTAISIDIYEESKVIAGDYTLVWLPFADREHYNYTNTGYGINYPEGQTSKPLDPSSYTVKITITNSEGQNVTEEVFKNGVLVKAGIYTITISGTINIGGKEYPFSGNVAGSNGDKVTVGEYYNTLELNDNIIEKSNGVQMTIGQRIFGDVNVISMMNVALTNYSMHGTNDDMRFNGGLVWNEEEKVYYVAPSAAYMNVPQSVIGKLPVTETEKNALVAMVQKGMKVNFYYSSAETAPETNSTDWLALCDDNGYVKASGYLWIKAVAEFDGQESIAVSGRQINVAAADVAITGGVSVKGGIYTFYKNQKINIADTAKVFVNGVSKDASITNDMISADNASVLNKDGYIRFTATGNYTLKINISEKTVVEIKFVIVETALENNFSAKSVGDYAFFGVGADLYQIMADAKLYKQLTINENGILVKSDATAADIKAGDPIGNGTLVILTDGIAFDDNGIITAIPDNCKQIKFKAANNYKEYALNAAAGEAGSTTISQSQITTKVNVGDNIYDIIVANNGVVMVDSVDATTGKASVTTANKEWLKSNSTFDAMGMGAAIDADGNITALGMMGYFGFTINGKQLVIVNS